MLKPTLLVHKDIYFVNVWQWSYRHRIGNTWRLATQCKHDRNAKMHMTACLFMFISYITCTGNIMGYCNYFLSNITQGNFLILSFPFIKRLQANSDKSCPTQHKSVGVCFRNIPSTRLFPQQEWLLRLKHSYNITNIIQ